MRSHRICNYKQVGRDYIFCCKVRVVSVKPHSPSLALLLKIKTARYRRYQKRSSKINCWVKTTQAWKIEDAEKSARLSGKCSLVLARAQVVKMQALNQKHTPDILCVQKTKDGKGIVNQP